MKKKKNKSLILLLLIIIIVLLGFNYSKKNNLKKENSNSINIYDYYNKYVKTNKETNLYNKNNEKVGKVGKSVELELEELEDSNSSGLFKINNLEGNYYIKYTDIEAIDSLTIVNDRYKNYIVFNESIITNDSTEFYDDNNNLIYSLKKSFEFPIIIKYDDKYGIEFNNRLLYIKSSNVKEIKESINTDKKNSSGVGVLNYHAFYDENNLEEKKNCVTTICHSKSQFKSHLDLFKEENILTITMSEMEMYIDGNIQLPKSVLITIDDGPKTNHAVDLLKEYKMHATIFLVTSWFDKNDYYTNEYIEFHSHTHNMHEVGDCPGGQGGGIKCLEENVIQEDLKKSREKLNNTTAIAYPFYEYNEYSIKMLKQAGFTMAFVGESSNSDNLVHVDSDKFRLKRFVIVTYTTIKDLKNYFNQIK